MLQRASRWHHRRPTVFSRGIVAILLLAGAPASALEVGDGWLLRRWAPEHGLPVVGVNALARDDLGYLWLATFDGLVRFDGVRFVRADPDSDLPSLRLTSLWRGAGGTLWVSTETSDLGLYDGRRLRRVAAPRGCGDGKLRAIRRGDDGRLLLALGSCLHAEGPGGLGPARVRLDGPSIRTFAVATDGTARNATLWRVVTAPGRENQVELGSRQDHYADPHLTGVALVAGELPARRAARISLARALDQG